MDGLRYRQKEDAAERFVLFKEGYQSQLKLPALFVRAVCVVL
jgi:hypothetical protein